MEAIFHFGMTKTGSTSIQQTLFKLTSEAGNGRFAYFAPNGKVNANKVLDALYSEGRRRVKKGRRPFGEEGLAGEQSELRDLLRQEAARSTADRWLFSSEGLMYAKEENVSELRSFFSEAGHKTRAAGYIRTPKAFIESAFQERAKRLGKINPRLEKRLGHLYPSYRERFEKFDRVFGRDSVDFWLFSPKTLLNGCVVQDFAGRIGVEIPEGYISRNNDSLSRPALTLLSAWRTYNDGVVLQRRAVLINKLRALEGAKVRFHSNLVAPVLEENRDDIAWMEDRLGASLTEDLKADDASAIKSMDELLVFEPATLQWLSHEIADSPLSQDVLSGDPQVVAMGVSELFVLEKEARREANSAAGEGRVRERRADRNRSNLG